jgi:hypothetical protein
MIRHLSRETVSHFAIVFDNRILFHSNFYGAHLEWLDNFIKHSEIVYRIDLELPLEAEELIYQECIKRFDGEPYDWGALAYWLYAMVGYRYFGKPLPTRNLWGSGRANLCLELAQCLTTLGVVLPDLDMVLPEHLYFILKERLNGYIPKP